jgi:hypothetical protein
MPPLPPRPARFTIKATNPPYSLLRQRTSGQEEIPQHYKGGSTLVTLPRIVTPYRDSVDGTRGRVTYQKLVTM